MKKVEMPSKITQQSGNIHCKAKSAEFINGVLNNCSEDDDTS